MIKGFFWFLWLQLADFCFRFKKDDKIDSSDNYRPIYTTNTGICQKCAFSNVKCKGEIFDELTAKYGDCCFSDKQYYYVKYK